MALLAGCGPKLTVVLLSEVPEIDHSAIDPLVAYESAEISKDRLFVLVTGTAKEDMGLFRKVKVQRYTKDGLLDTKDAFIKSSKEVEQPAPQPVDPDRDSSVMPPRPPMPPPPIIEEGGPVQIALDATISGGKITKLVIQPTLEVGPSVPMLPQPEPGSTD